MRMPEFRLTGSGIVKMGTITIIFLLIVLMPLTAVTVGEVTTVRGISADDMRLVAESGGLYYIDYSGEEPYIRTNDNIYNQYIVTDYHHYRKGLDYDKRDNMYYLIPDQGCNYDCHLTISFAVDSNQYYIAIRPYYVDRVYIYGTRGNNDYLVTQVFPELDPIYIYVDELNYERIKIRIYPDIFGQSSFLIDVYRSDRVINYIDRPVNYDMLTHSDYNFMGNLIVTGYRTGILSLDILHKIRFGAIQKLFEFVGELFRSIINTNFKVIGDLFKSIFTFGIF